MGILNKFTAVCFPKQASAKTGNSENTGIHVYIKIYVHLYIYLYIKHTLVGIAGLFSHHELLKVGMSWPEATGHLLDEAGHV